VITGMQLLSQHQCHVLQTRGEKEVENCLYSRGLCMMYNTYSRINISLLLNYSLYLHSY